MTYNRLHRSIAYYVHCYNVHCSPVD